MSIEEPMTLLRSILVLYVTILHYGPLVADSSISVDTCSGLMSYSLSSAPSGGFQDFIATVDYGGTMVFQSEVLNSVGNVLMSNIFCRDPSLQMQIMYTDSTGGVVNHSHDLGLTCVNGCLVKSIPQNSDPSVGGLTIPSTSHLNQKLSDKFSNSEAILVSDRLSLIEDAYTMSKDVLGDPFEIRAMIDELEDNVSVVTAAITNLESSVSETCSSSDCVKVSHDNFFQEIAISVVALLLAIMGSFARLWWRVRKLEFESKHRTENI